MSGIVLAGGRATRMKEPCDKAFLKIAGEPIIKRQLKVLKKIFKEVIIVTNSNDRYKNLKGVKVIPDILPGRGPLGGIYSGLLASKDRYNFVVACDMPFINEALIKYMIDTKDNHDIIIAKKDKKFHPLFGIYNKNCIPIIEEMLKQDRLKISDIFSHVKTHFILKQEIERFDEKLLSLVNINTVEDLERVREREADV
ncbi:MAG: molybdenum cofactor guanylyltransferase, partial [Candidatus Omnitrophica bacterium]|nr:molybdenum cofactor guanylyltransferase [Candidatus Omnitrophota bacterium]